MGTWRTIVASALLSGAAIAQAQGVEALAGTWYGPYQFPGGLVVEIELRVDGTSGTRQQMPRGRPAVPNPCLGRPHPVEVTPTGPGAFRVHVQASEMVAGCQDARLTLRLADNTHLEGAFGDGRAFKLQRR